MKTPIKPAPLIICAAAIAFGVAAYMIEIPFMDRVDYVTLDSRFKFRGETAPGPHVVIAVVDEKSLAVEGKWDWPRVKIAELITKLSDAGASVIAFDVVFAEPDDRRVVDAIDGIRRELVRRDMTDVELEDYLTEIEAQTDYDSLLAQAVRKSKAKVVLGYFLQMEYDTSQHMDPQDIPIHQENIISSRYAYAKYRQISPEDVAFVTAIAPQSNIEVVSSAAEYSGTFNMLPDPDGVVRRMPAVFELNGELYAPLSLQAVSAFTNSQPSVEVSYDGVLLRIGDLQIPTDEVGRIMINYRGKEKTFPHVSITDILQGAVPDETFKDKIVIVGVTATGEHDLRVTPFSPLFPGPEIQANVVDSILTGDFLYRPAWAATFDILAILIGGLVLGIILPRTGLAANALWGGGLFFGYILFCQYMFSVQGWILNLVYPLCVVLLVYVSITAYKYFTESRQKRFVRNTFETYLAPAVVKQLMDSPEKIALGGEERVITAFFSDVEGFTSISERLTAADLVELLNEFLNEMTGIILDYEGTVDKFEGDAIIAIFGAPNDVERQAETACKACVDMQKRLVELRRGWQARGKPELRMRIGLCTGPAVVGNMGSTIRMDYTMMGDTVNTAARLEGVNKAYGIYTLIGESTYSETGDGVFCREIDLINVVGKREPLKVYQVLGYADDVGEPLRKVVDHYEKGLHAYRDRDWDGAKGYFEAALGLDPDDGPSRAMLARCDSYEANPPAEDWDGSFAMTSK